MKAFLHRLRSKEKDSRESRLDREKPLEARQLEKPSPTLLPVIPPPFKQGDDFFADPALLSDRTSGPQQPNAITRALSAHNRTNNTNPPSNITSNSSRPQSQLDISMQKPLPPISPIALSMIKDEPSSSNRRSQEGNRSSNVSSSPVTPRVGGSRARGDPDSQGRSTLSKQSQSTSSQLNSMTTDDTSYMAGSSSGATQTQNPTSPAAGGAGPKKVAFISPPPTPGGLSISTALPDMVADLNSDNGGGSNPTSPPPGHQHTNSITKSITGSTKDASALDTSTDSAASLALKGGVPVTTPSGRSSTTNLASKVSTSKSSPSAPGLRGVTSPSGARAAGTPVPSSAPPRSQSRNDFAQSTVSFRSGTPYSYLSGRSTTIQPPSSWSEAAEEDLVSNLGPRERTRQEVLWEIVTSEQRYVSDLIKLKETFIDPLLHPYASSAPPFASDDPFFRATSPTESIEHLPIASRFLASPTPGQKPPGENVAGIGTVGYSRQRTASEGPRSAGRMQDDAQSIGSADDDGDDKLGRLGSSVPYLGGLKGAFKDRVRLGSGNSGKSPPMTGANSPYGKSGGSGSKSKVGGSARSSAQPIPSRSHQSLPPPSRNPGMQAATSSRQSLVDGSETIREGAATSMSVRTSDTRKWASSTTVGNTASKLFGNRKLSKVPPILEGSSSLLVSEGIEGLAVPTHLLPPDLRVCLEVLEESLKGHMTLFEGLRKRYDEQYPLVRSLADVFVANAHILKGYATYVLHLEKALEEVDNALLTPETSKKPKNQGAADWAKVCRLFKRLEEIASDKGETGLAISLSKPFQRLLKYPLMFQNLLFHTDPSTFEYEATLEMVAEVEKIVRSIEDEKIQKEERDKTRDVFARIDGLEKVKLLAVPKPSRVLIEEKQIIGVDVSIPEAGGKQLMTMSQVSGASASGKNVRAKASFKRLSDVLGSSGGKNGVGGKNDLWLVRFNDVVLRCQRTGTTSLPLATGPSSGSRASSMPDLGAGKAKYATTGRRASQLKPRNLYKFLKIETWVIGNAPKSRPGMVSMEDISRSRSSGIVAIEPVKSGETDDEDGNDSDDSDRKSKMSFSYWGADKITVDPVAAAKLQQRAAAAQRQPSTGKRSSLAPTAYLRPESDSQPAARAKFAHRLRNSEADEDLPNSLRSSARRGVSTSSASGSRRAAAASIDDTTTSVGSRKPAWNTKTSSPSAPGGVRRVREQSITSTNSAAAARLKAASPAPTEDSGVVWIDPSVNRF
ncbi:hypothetical protein FRC01_001447 [Tulasnella sp. 417]|nr:hypothetical protein FRC01_001447 [Tulasnella sp. 417]